jgi:hypothetical protein
MRASRERSAITLMEVLVAIFVMALGLMALLTLFPLGALNMAQAIKDDRAAHAGANASAIARTAWKLATAANLADPDPLLDSAMLNPYPAPGNLPDRTGLPTPSYPVYVDPFGVLNYGSVQPAWGQWLAGTPGTIRRTTLTELANPPPGQTTALMTFQQFSSPDDITLGDNGIPPAPPGVDRQRRYSWAYLVRRARCTDPTQLELTVVVYGGRSLQLSADLIPDGETVYQGNFVQGSTVATLTWTAGQEKPAVRAGNWILDATMTSSPPSTSFIPRGYFYRVISVTDLPGNTMELGLQTPARDGIQGEVAQAIVLENVVEVFEKAPLTP